MLESSVVEITVRIWMALAVGLVTVVFAAQLVMVK